MLKGQAVDCELQEAILYNQQIYTLGQFYWLHSKFKDKQVTLSYIMNLNA